MNSRRFVTQEFLCMKPYWVELIKLFLLISNYILSVILPCSDVSESTVTGRGVIPYQAKTPSAMKKNRFCSNFVD